MYLVRSTFSFGSFTHTRLPLTSTMSFSDFCFSFFVKGLLRIVTNILGCLSPFICL